MGQSKKCSHKVDVTLLDFIKAFDSVPHQRLLAKLKGYGIGGNLLNWLTHFIVGRKQRVSFSGHFSPWTMVTSGVPQGSVLGPVLFLAYRNDITTGVRSNMRLFADDSKVYRIIYDENDEKQLQCDLNTLQKRSENWQLRFHPDKCEVLRVTNARDHTSYPYKLSGCTLQSVTKIVDLGVSLTSNLSWDTQTQKVVNKANKIVGFLKRNVGPGNKEVFSRLYKALVIPILEYAVPLWSPYLQKNIDALERVQRRASKYALPMSSRDSPYGERLAMLGWSSLQSRRSYLSLLECYKTIFVVLMASTVMIILNLIVMVKQDQTIHLN